LSLSCSCEYDHEFGPGEWMYWFQDSTDFIPLGTSKRKRCCSCGKLIDIDGICIKYPRYRYPYSDVESRIKHGCDLDNSLCDEPNIRIADHYHCEQCAEIFLNLTDVGFYCLSPEENMESSLKEYHELSGFKANKTLVADQK